MNKNWTDFLTSNNASISPELDIIFPDSSAATEHSISPVFNLAIVKVTGADATQFLQGQLTCNINKITETNSFFAAYCNAKGRTISTLLIFKMKDDYFIILPKELMDKVIAKLRMYVLRSDVTFENVSDTFCLLGLTTTNPEILSDLPKNSFNIKQGIIKLPSKIHRYLIIKSVDNAQSIWTQLIQDHNVSPANSETWKYQDISAGIPWLSSISSEEYIPQMLNIDKLGGISFNKGCYTGQEIVARTHYLGKAKRELFLAECSSTAMLDHNNQIFVSDSEQAVGKILSIQSNNQTIRMLTVMQNPVSDFKKLSLNNPDNDVVNIIDFQ